MLSWLKLANFTFILPINRERFVGWDGAVGLATRYGLGDQWIESRWRAKFSAPVHTGSGARSPSSIMK
jgi:hypothetical protein